MKESKLDVMAVGAHPDDVELGCGGLLLQLKKKGYQLGIVDLTEGEMATKGTVESRQKEAREASEVLGADARVQMNFPDGHLSVTRDRKEKLAEKIREHRPKIILAPHREDFHPDHEAAGSLVREASLLASRAEHRSDHPHFAVQKVVSYMIHHSFDPAFVVDITDTWEEKLDLVRIFRSQLGDRETESGPDTNLSSEGFLERFRARHLMWGREIGVRYGEPYYVRGGVPLADPVERWAGGDLQDHIRPTSGP